PAFAAALAIAVVPNLSHLAPAGYQDLDAHLWTPAYLAESGFETTTSGEFMPKWMHALPRYRPEARVVSGSGGIRQGVAQIQSSPTIELLIVYFPGWEVRVEGSEIPTYPAESTGLIRFALGPGSHQIEWQWKRTGPRWAGELLSLLALVGCAGVFAFKRI